MPKDFFTDPCTKEELERFKEVFQKMPTYNDKGYILSSDIRLLLASIECERTPEQIKAYEDYWNNSFGGIIGIDEFTSVFSSLHDTCETMRLRVSAYDKDGNGFISLDEFLELIKLMIIHEPKLEGISYEQFVKEADTNHDGKVSVEECEKWVQDHIPPV